MWTSHHPYHSFLLAHPPISSSQDKTGVKPSVLSWIHITKMRELHEANILYCGGIVLLLVGQECKTNLYPTFLKYFFKTTPPPLPLPLPVISFNKNKRLNHDYLVSSSFVHAQLTKTNSKLKDFFNSSHEQMNSFVFPCKKKGKIPPVSMMLNAFVKSHFCILGDCMIYQIADKSACWLSYMIL